MLFLKIETSEIISFFYKKFFGFGGRDVPYVPPEEPIILIYKDSNPHRLPKLGAESK